MLVYGIAEIAQALQVKRQAVAKWNERRKLPSPDEQLAMGPVWRAETIEPWIRLTIENRERTGEQGRSSRLKVERLGSSLYIGDDKVERDGNSLYVGDRALFWDWSDDQKVGRPTGDDTDVTVTPEARLGSALRRAREERGISLRGMARKLYRSHSNLVEYERGHRLAPAEVVEGYESELALAPGTLLALHEKAELEIYGDGWHRRVRAPEPVPRELGTRDAKAESLKDLEKARRTTGATVRPSALTQREREVTRLAAQGLTTRQIAERLFVSPRTIEAHLAHVYAKLGVESKANLIRKLADLNP